MNNKITEAIKRHLPAITVEETAGWEVRRWWTSLDDSAIVVASKSSLVRAASTEAARLTNEQIADRIENGLPVYAQIDGHLSTYPGGEWKSEKTYLRVSGYDLSGGIFLGGPHAKDYFTA